MAAEEISAEFEDLSTEGKWLESQTVVVDVTSMPLKARRDARDLRGHCGGSYKTIYSSNTSKNLESMQITIIEVYLHRSWSSEETRTHDR